MRPDTTTAPILDVLQYECCPSDWDFPLEAPGGLGEDDLGRPAWWLPEHGWFLYHHRDNLASEGTSTVRRKQRLPKKTDKWAPTEACPSIASALDAGACPESLAKALLFSQNEEQVTLRERDDIVRCLSSWLPQSCSFYEAELAEAAERERDTAFCWTRPRLRHNRGEGYAHVEPRGVSTRRSGTVIATQVGCWVSTPSLDGTDVQEHDGIIRFYYYEVSGRQGPLSQIRVGWGTFENELEVFEDMAHDNNLTIYVKKTPSEQSLTLGLVDVKVTERQAIVGVLLATNGRTAITVDGEIKQAGRLLAWKTPRLLFPALQIVECQNQLEKPAQCCGRQWPKTRRGPSDSCEEKKAPLRTNADDAKADNELDSFADGDEQLGCNINLGSQPFVNDATNLAAQLSSSSTKAEIVGFARAALTVRLSLHGGSSYSCPVYTLGAHAFERDTRGATLEVIVKVNTGVDSILAWRCDAHGGLALCLFRERDPDPAEHAETKLKGDVHFTLGFVFFDIQGNCPANMGRFVSFDTQKHPIRRICRGSWHHVAVGARRSRRGDDVSLFVDGVKLDTKRIEDDAPFFLKAATRIICIRQSRFGDNSALVIGAPAARMDESSEEPQLSGELGEARLWTERLSRRTVAATYSRGSVAGDEPRLAACWPFDEASGSAIRNVAVDLPKSWLGPPLQVDCGFATWLTGVSSGDNRRGGKPHLCSENPNAESAAPLSRRNNCNAFFFNDDTAIRNGPQGDVSSIFSIAQTGTSTGVAHGGAALPRLVQTLLDAESALISHPMEPSKEDSICLKTLVLNAIAARIFRLASAVLASRATEARKLRVASDAAFFPIIGVQGKPEAMLLAIADLLSLAATPIIALAAARWLRASLAALCERGAVSAGTPADLVTEVARDRIFSRAVSRLRSCCECGGVSVPCILCLEVSVLLTEGQNFDAFFMLGSSDNCLVRTITNPTMPEVLRRMIFDTVANRRRLYFELVPVMIRPRLIADVALDLASSLGGFKDDACAVPRVGDICRHVRSKTLGVVTEILMPEINLTAENSYKACAPFAQVVVDWPAGSKHPSVHPTVRRIPRQCRVQLVGKCATSYKLRTTQRTDPWISSCNDNEDDITVVIIRNASPIKTVDHRVSLLTVARDILPPSELKEVLNADDEVLRRVLAHAHSDRFLDETCFGDSDTRFWRAIRTARHLPVLMDDLIDRIPDDPSARRLFYTILSLLDASSSCDAESADIRQSPHYLVGRAPSILIHVATGIAKRCIIDSRNRHLLYALRVIFERLCRFDGFSGGNDLLVAARALYQELSKSRDLHDRGILGRIEILLCRVISECTASLLLPHDQNEHGESCLEYWRRLLPAFSIAESSPGNDHPTIAWLTQLLEHETAYADLEERLTKAARIPAALVRLGGKELDSACKFAVAAAMFHAPIYNFSTAAGFESALLSVWRQIPRLRSWATAQADTKCAADRIRQNAEFLLSLSNRSSLHEDDVNQYDPAAIFRFCREAKQDDLECMKQALMKQDNLARCRAAALTAWLQTYQMSCRNVQEAAALPRAKILLRALSPPRVNGSGQRHLPWVLSVLAENSVKASELAHQKANAPQRFLKMLIECFPQRHHAHGCREFQKFVGLDGASHGAVEMADKVLDNVYAVIAELSDVHSESMILSLAAAWAARILYMSGRRDDLTLTFVPKLVGTSISIERKLTLSTAGIAAVSLGLLACKVADNLSRNELTARLLETLQPCMLNRNSCDSILRLLLLGAPSIFANDDQWIELFSMISSESWRGWRLVRVCSASPKSRFRIPLALVDSALNAVAARFRYDDALFPSYATSKSRSSLLPAAAEACALLREVSQDEKVMGVLANAIATARQSCLDDNGGDLDDVNFASAFAKGDMVVSRCLAALQVLGGFREWPTIGKRVNPCQISRTRHMGTVANAVYVVANVKEADDGVDVCDVIGSGISETATDVVLVVRAHEIEVIDPTPIEGTDSASIVSVCSELAELAKLLCFKTKSMSSASLHLVRIGAAKCVRLISSCGDGIYSKVEHQTTKCIMETLSNSLSCVGATLLERAVAQYRVGGIAACEDVEVAVEAALNRSRTIARRRAGRQQAVPETMGKNAPAENRFAQNYLFRPYVNDGKNITICNFDDQNEHIAQQLHEAASKTSIDWPTSHCSEGELASRTQHGGSSGSSRHLSSPDTLQGLARLREMGLSSSLSSRALEYAEGDINTALKFVLADDAAANLDACNKDPNVLCDQDNDTHRSEREDDEERRHVEEYERQIETEVKCRDEGHENKEDLEEQKPWPLVQISNQKASEKLLPVHDGISGDAAASKFDGEDAGNTLRSEDEKNEDRIFTCKTSGLPPGDHYGVADQQYFEVSQGMSNIADAKNTYADLRHESATVDTLTNANQTAIEDRSQIHNIAPQGLSSGQSTASLIRVPQHAPIEEDDDESRWPRMYHVNARSTIALRAFPRASAALVLEVRGDDELIAFGESGDWLHVKVVVSNRNSFTPPVPTVSASCANGQSVFGSTSDGPPTTLPPAIQQQQLHTPWNKMSAAAAPAPLNSSLLLSLNSTDDGNHPLTISNANMTDSPDGILSTLNLRELSQQSYGQHNSPAENVISERAASESSAGVSASQASEITVQGDSTRCNQSPLQQQLQTVQILPRRNSQSVHAQSSGGDLREISECSSVTSVYEDIGNSVANAEDTRNSAAVSATGISQPLSLRTLSSRQHREFPVGAHRPSFVRHGNDDDEEDHDDINNDGSVGECAVVASGSMIVRGDDSVAESSLFCYAFSHEGAPVAGSVVSETDRGTVLMFGENMSERESNVWGIESVRDDASLVSTSRGDLGIGDDGAYLFCESVSAVDEPAGNLQGHQRRMAIPPPILVESGTIRNLCVHGITGWVERSRVKLGPSPNCHPPTEEEQDFLASPAFLSSASQEVQEANENEKAESDVQAPLESRVVPAFNSHTTGNCADTNHTELDLKAWTGLAIAGSATEDSLAEACDGDSSKNCCENKAQSIAASCERRCSYPKDDFVNLQNTDGDCVHKAGVVAMFPRLEAETGDEFYHREDRYFGTRQGDAPARCDDFRCKSSGRKAEAVTHDFLAVNTTRKLRIPQNIPDKHMYVSATQSLANSAAILVTLQFRQLVMALLLYWSSLASAGGGLPCNRVVEFFVGQASLCHQEIAQNIVAFYRLILFRDWTPDWLPAVLTSQILGAPLSFPLGGTLLPALLTPLLSHLMSHPSESSRKDMLSRALRLQVVEEVRSHLEAASASSCDHHITTDSQLALREARTVASEESRQVLVGSRRNPLILTDIEVSQRCCLPWAQWVSRIMFMRDSSVPTAEDASFTDLFRAWLNCMNSSDLRLKQHAASELAAMLSSLVGRQATDVVSACIREIPMIRLHHLASWRLLREADSYPVVSRYLQAIIDLIATARIALNSLPESNGQTDIVKNRAQSSGASQKHLSKAAGESRVPFALHFDGEGSMLVGGRDIHPPWTAEFLIYRQHDDADPFLLSTSAICEPMEVHWVPAICLATTLATGHTIRLQKGGALLAGSEARKLCVGGVAFDYEVPIGRWIHLALVARERSPNSTEMLCGPRALKKCGPADERHLTACTHSLAQKHVVELFADGESKGVVSCRAQLPCGQVGLDCPPKQKSIVDHSGILLGVSDEAAARAVLRRRSHQHNSTKSTPVAKHAHSRRTIETARRLIPPRACDDDDAHLVLEEGGACAVRSPRCYLGMVRYWSVARTASDIKRYRTKHPPAVASTGLLGTWELAFDEVSSSCSAAPMSIAPRFAADSNENFTGCALRGDASWIELPNTAPIPEFLQDSPLPIVPDHDTDRNIVLHGTVVRHKVPNVTFGPLCRPQTEALILRLAVQENDNIAGIVDWHDRSLAFMIQGRVTKRLTGLPTSANDEEPCWGDELQFELTVGDIVLGCDQPALSQLHKVQELARYDDERSLDTCCVISPYGATIWGTASVDCEANHERLAEVSGVWTGRIEYAPDAVQAALREFQLNDSRISAKSPSCRIDEAALPSRLSLRPVYGDYARNDDDAAHMRRLLISSTTGGHFCAVGTVIQDDGEQDVIFPPLSPRLEEAKYREVDVGSAAGELSVRASVAARDAADAILACASSLDDAADDNARVITRGAVEKRVQSALDLAAQAAAARRAAADAGTVPLPFEAASQRVKRRNAGPPPALTNSCYTLGQRPGPAAHYELCQTADERAAAPLHFPDDAANSDEALPVCEMDDSHNNEPSDEMLEDDDKEDKCVKEDSAVDTDRVRRHMQDITRTEIPHNQNAAKWWGIGARCGKWCWEWDVRRVASGELAVGVVGKRADSSIKLGSDEYGWAYRSTGVVTHGGDHLVTASFGPGDVVGVEVEIFLNEERRKLGRVRFFKNGIEVAPNLGVEKNDRDTVDGDSDTVDAEVKTISHMLLASKRRRNQIEIVHPTSGMAKMLNIDEHEASLLFDMTGTSPQRGGLRAAAQVGGAGDAVVFLGFKMGFGSRRSVPQISLSDNSDDRTHCVELYSGEWGLSGVRHGRGELSYSHCTGRWFGAWYNDKQHGVHLWIEDGEVTPILFDRGQRVDTVLSDTDACQELNAYNNTLVRGSSDKSTLTAPSDALDVNSDRSQCLSIKNSTEAGNPQIALWTLRVVYQRGATARIGFDIDSSEVVRRVEVGEELEAVERAVTADGVPRYKVRLRNEKVDSREYGWISEHLRGGARDVVCLVLRQVVNASAPFLRYRVTWAGGATIRSASAFDSTKVGVAPQSTALWVAERVRLANGTYCLRIVAPKSWVGWVSEEENIIRREPTRHELAHQALIRERSCIQLSKRQSLRAQPLFDSLKSGFKENCGTCSVTELGIPTSLPQVTATFEASRRSPFLLDRRQCASGIDLSSDLLTATCVASRAGRGVVLGTKLMRRGLHYWEVRVDQATWGSIFVGVAAHGDVVGADASLCDSNVCKRNLSDVKARQPSRLSTSQSNSRQQHSLLPLRTSVTRLLISRQGSTTRSVPSAGWGGLGFVNYRATQAFGAEAGYGSYVGPGDVVGVLFDADRGTISFVKDGEDLTAGRPVVVNLGVAFSSIWRRAASRSPASMAGLYACFGLKGEGDSLSLRGCKSWSSFNDPLRKSVPPRLARLEVIINALIVLDSWRAHARLLGSGRQPGLEYNQRGWRLVAEAANRIHSRWRKRQKTTVLESRTLGNVELETSRKSVIIAAINSGLPEDWTRTALRLGAPCRVPQGEVRIVGVARGQIWFAGPSLDEGRAWYWTAQELLCAAMTGAFFAAPPFPSNHSEQPSQDTGSPEIQLKTPESSPPLLAAECLHIPKNKRCTGIVTPYNLFGEEALSLGELALFEPVDFLNTFEAEDARVDGPLSTIVEGLAKSLQVAPALVPAAQLACAVGLERTADGDWHATQPESLRGVSAKTIARRFALICALNDSVNVALPYVDLGRGDLALAELGDLRGGIMNTVPPPYRERKAVLLEEPTENDTYLRPLATTSYYGALAAAKADSLRPRTLQCALSRYFVASATECESLSVKHIAPLPYQSKLNGVPSQVYDRSDSWTVDESNIMAALMGENNSPWSPDSWWAGAVPPCSKRDLECCSQIPTLHALVRPAARSWSGGRALVDLRSRLFFHNVKCAFWWRILNATTTSTTPTADEYDRPDELREFQVNRLHSTQRCYAHRQDSTYGWAERGVEHMEKSSQAGRRGISVQPVYQVEVEGDVEDDDPNCTFGQSGNNSAMDSARAFREAIEKQTVFGQLRAQMRSRCDARALRRAFIHIQDGGQPRAFYVKFIGEGVDDHGGPYRAVFQSALVDEPKLKTLELLVDTPASELVLRANEEIRSVDDDFYRHFGRLLGVAGRHRVSVDLRLSRHSFWGPLAAQCMDALHNSADALDPDDSALIAAQKALFAIDDEQSLATAHNDVLEVLRCLDQRTTASVRRRLLRSDIAAVAFLTQISPASGVASFLCKSCENSDNKVHTDQLNRICSQLGVSRRARARALASLVRGASATVPVELFSLFDAEQLEEILCGAAEVDLDELRQNARYESVNSDEPHIQYFWQALENFNARELAAFVKFCSGSARPPRGESTLNHQCLKITRPPPGADEKPDAFLPLSQTCFFSLALPRYSSAAVCAKRLRYAIENAHLMDGDFLMRHSEGWDILDA